MKIELKKLKIYPLMTEETTAFSANIHVDGVFAGYAKNDGGGGCTDIIPIYSDSKIVTEKSKRLLEAAEAYCKANPISVVGYTFKLDSLEDIVDNLVADEEEKKKLAKLEKRGLVYRLKGTTGDYRILSWTGTTLAKMLARPDGKEIVKKAIAKIKQLHEDNEIINTNLPEDLIPKELTK